MADFISLPATFGKCQEIYKPASLHEMFLDLETPDWGFKELWDRQAAEKIGIFARTWLHLHRSAEGEI